MTALIYLSHFLPPRYKIYFKIMVKICLTAILVTIGSCETASLTQSKRSFPLPIVPAAVDRRRALNCWTAGVACHFFSREINRPLVWSHTFLPAGYKVAVSCLCDLPPDTLISSDQFPLADVFHRPRRVRRCRGGTEQESVRSRIGECHPHPLRPFPSVSPPSGSSIPFKVPAPRRG